MVSLQWTQLKPTADPNNGAPCARSSHGVSLVSGDRLIVYGGEHKARTPIDSKDAAWIVDGLTSDKPAWRCLGGVTTAPPDRIAHAQAVYDNKYVYLFGGRAGITMNEQAMNDLWVLDCSGEPGTESWSQVQVDENNNGTTPPEARSFHRMICVGSSLYVFGGCGATSGRLADLHRFDIPTRTWHAMDPSSLRGRGGPNLFTLENQSKLAVVAGFCGEESADGQVYDISTGKWNESLLQSEGLRPRSVCVSASFPSLGLVVVFGGEVDPSDRGHEGAGGFENDVVLLDETTGVMKETIKSKEDWPETRGWSDAASSDTDMFVFGGLSGNDTNPRRLDDLWKLSVAK